MIAAPLGSVLLFGRIIYGDLTTPYGDYPLPLQVLGWTCLGACMLAACSTLFRQGVTTLPPLDAPKKDEKGDSEASSEVSSEQCV